MKEIWINLEFYFESYEFSNFRDFSGIFLIFSKFLINFLGFSGIKIRYFEFNINFSEYLNLAGDVAQSEPSDRSRYTIAMRRQRGSIVDV